MAVEKAHKEFFSLDFGGNDWTVRDGFPEGWALPDGYAPDALAAEKILAGSLDEARKQGSRTRILRMEPGFISTKPFVHDYWEEVYLLDGEMNVGHDGTGQGGETFSGPTYAVRPPGVYHGPFKTDKGALLLEIHYYDPA